MALTSAKPKKSQIIISTPKNLQLQFRDIIKEITQSDNMRPEIYNKLIKYL